MQFPDNEVNIIYEDRNGPSSNVYNKTSAISIPFALNIGQDTVNVTVCTLNNTSLCQSVITGLCEYV